MTLNPSQATAGSRLTVIGGEDCARSPRIAFAQQPASRSRTIVRSSVAHTGGGAVTAAAAKGVKQQGVGEAAAVPVLGHDACFRAVATTQIAQVGQVPLPGRETERADRDGDSGRRGVRRWGSSTSTSAERS